MRRLATISGAFGIALASMGPAAVHAQQAPATLSLEEALTLARRHSPSFRAVANDEAVADWNARAAYGDLLPDAWVSGGLGWRAGGTPRIGDIDLGLGETPAVVSSSYGLSLSMQLSGATLFRVAQQRAARTATGARIDAAEYNLDTEITRLYLAALRAQDAAVLAERELETAAEAFKLAEARVASGAASRLDVAQAEVERGRAEVSLLQAQMSAETERLQLLQAMGVDAATDVTLTSELEVFQPSFTREQLVADAMRGHPSLQAARADEAAGRAALRAARMLYLPSISVSGGWSGYTQAVADEDYLINDARSGAQGRVQSCERTNDLYSRLARPLPMEDCSRFAFTDGTRDALLRQNSLFPFDFTKQPAAFSMTVSLPVFNGFTREAQLQQASAQAEDARYARRQEELQRRTAVATTHLALETAYRAVQIEERNVAAAAEQLELARERYRLGAGSILELSQAQSARARAEQAHLAARYSFHENLAALEAAVGRRLR